MHKSSKYGLCNKKQKKSPQKSVIFRNPCFTDSLAGKPLFNNSKLKRGGRASCPWAPWLRTGRRSRSRGWSERRRQRWRWGQRSPQSGSGKPSWTGTSRGTSRERTGSEWWWSQPRLEENLNVKKYILKLLIKCIKTYV